MSQATASVSINDVFADVKAQDERLRTLEGETRKVHDQMKSLLEDLAKFRSSITPASSQEKPATKELTYAQSDVEAIGRAALGNIVNLPPRSHTPQSQISSNSMTPPSNASGESPPAPETPEIYKASRDDPTWKVLPAALRKHRIHLDDWPNYAMFISYGPRGPTDTWWNPIAITYALSASSSVVVFFSTARTPERIDGKARDLAHKLQFGLFLILLRSTYNLSSYTTAIMDGLASERHILDWDETDVHNWLSSLGYPQYESQIREHKVQGDTLCDINADGLKSLGVATIGQRLSILKAIYQVKVAHNIPIGEQHYVPPSESSERGENINVEKLHSLVKEQGKLRTLEEDNRSLTGTLQSFIDEFNGLRASSGRADDPSNALRRQPSFKWAFQQPQKSPTKAEAVDSPTPSPQRVEHSIPPSYNQPPPLSATSTVMPSEKSRPTPPPTDPLVGAPKATRQESSDNLKSFKVSLEDPTWKVLPAALKKYRINNDNWQSYAMFICYGPSGAFDIHLRWDHQTDNPNRQQDRERLKDSKKNPVFMLKHIKDIRSPIAVAQQKHAARKASSIISQESHVTNATSGHQRTASAARNPHRPAKLEVSDTAIASTPLLSTGLSPQPGWPDATTPNPEAHRQDDTSGTPSSAQGTHMSTSSSYSVASTSTLVASSNGHPSVRKSAADEPSASGGANNQREMPTVVSTGVSYAVAIYPYMAEQDDEFDVVVGDTFVILSRARGWWVVQRDPTGSGVVDTDIVKQGWVPAGCLLETNVPVASAIAEATAANSSSNRSPETSASRTPILPLSIISTSFPGVALMDYKKKGDEELDLVKDDALRVFKRYNHWSYAVKENGGDRGWVPSWFIGKVSPAGATAGTPPTPGYNMQHSNASSNMEDGQNQVSPMSSAFPPVQSRTAVVI
ncbi:hypothetical protein D9619_006350 [Psilocybe cf. subviscida]|uniref:SH3 domain-containing protein n=1 Tax=Psilocybe cf. subviscida TaxID=2480587 RepID=A0A8H5EXL4_9AGAR|nr:hypothetical protein D9619_006350 [Psilocybe cf. subviscida]